MNNLSEIKNTIQKLLNDKSISNYRIQKDTGVSYGNISELRNKKRQLKNLTLETVEKLYNYQKGIEKMNELNNKMIEDVVLGEVELIEDLGQYFIDIEGDYEYNVEFATLSEVDYKVCALYEVATSKTYEVPYHDKLEKEDMKLFYDKWLEKDQQEETYIESVFFVNREDAESYIKDVLKGKESLTEVAAEIGYFE